MAVTDQRYALAKRKRERAFSTPAPARFGVKIDQTQDRVTDFGKPSEAPLLTENNALKTIDRFIGQMGRRYSINIVKGARDVARDTVTGGEYGLKPAPAWVGAFVPDPMTATALYNLLGNEKVADMAAPLDFMGTGGIARAATGATVNTAETLGKSIGPIIKSSAEKLGKEGFEATTVGLRPSQKVVKAGRRRRRDLNPEEQVILPSNVFTEIMSGGRAGAAIDPKTPFNASEDITAVRPTTPQGVVVRTGESLEATGKGAIATRQATELNDVNVALVNAGLDPLPVKVTGGRPGETTISDYEKELYDAATVTRNVDIVSGTHPQGYDLFDMVRGGKAVHMLQNDHLIGSGFATWLINQRFKALGGQPPTQNWRDEQEAFLRWINSGENIQRVGRLWNQVKNGLPYEMAKEEFFAKMPKAAKAQFTEQYESYVMDALYGMGPDSFVSVMGKDLADATIKAWNSPEWLSANYGRVLERQQKQNTPSIFIPSQRG